MKAQITPHITEKSYSKIEGNAFPIYTFKIAKGMDKVSVKSAVEKEFNVTVTDVNIIHLPGKARRFRGMAGKTNKIFKALVRLKKGETIKAFDIEDTKADKE